MDVTYLSKLTYLERMKAKVTYKCKGCNKRIQIRFSTFMSASRTICRSCSSSIRMRTHGDSGSKEHKAWAGMKARCYNPNAGNYHKYGAKGITVCNRWLRSYESFLSDMGRAPSARHTLDRINNKKGYTPSNCRWATYSQQNFNRRPYFRKCQ